MPTMVTKDSLKEMLANPNPRYVEHVIGRALVTLFNNQTETEKKANETRIYNDIGFTGADARSGTITAKYFIKHGRLTEWQIKAWLKPNKRGEARILKYHKQLDQAAKLRAARELDLKSK